MYDVPLTDLYTLPLPRSLVSLSIQWMSRRATTDLPSLTAAKDGLLPRLPSLRRMWLCDWSTLALLWSRAASGNKECCSFLEVALPGRDTTAWDMRVAVFAEDTSFAC